MIAHSVLYGLLDCSSLQRAVRLKRAKRVGDGLFNKNFLGADFRVRLSSRGDMLGAARAKHLASIECGTAWPGHAMRSRGLADGKAAFKIGCAPCVYRKTAIHVLVVDCKFQRISRDVVFVPLVELDRQRVHFAQAIDRFSEQRSAFRKIGPHVVIESVEAELRVARYWKRIAVEVHEDFSARLALPEHREIQQTRPELEHSCCMEGPLVPFAENVGGEFLRGPIIVGEEVVLVPLRVARENIGHALHVRAREVPREIVPWRTDAELALGKIDRLDSRFQGKTERAKTMPGIDAVAIEFAGAAGRNDD